MYLGYKSASTRVEDLVQFQPMFSAILGIVSYVIFCVGAAISESVLTFYIVSLCCNLWAFDLDCQIDFFLSLFIRILLA